MKSEDFEDWFKGSGVVSVDGKPKLVYHQTYEEFDEFEDGVLGRRTEVASAVLGHWFTEDKSEAETFNDEDGRIITAYLKIANPLVLTREEFEEFEMDIISMKDAAKFGKKAITDGYDGIYVPMYGWWAAFSGKQVWII